MRLYVDANVVVYAIEGVGALRETVLTWIERAEAHPEGLLITSYLSAAECRVKPLRDGNTGLLGRFDGFFERDRLLLADVTREVLDRSSELRARLRLKTPDAIHLATALLHRASTLLTADPAFERCDEIRTILIDPAAS